MKKEREKIENAGNLIAKIQKGFRIRGALSIAMWILFAASVIVKLINNKGLVSYFLSFAYVETEHCLFFYPDALGEVAKTVGVSSLFIVWIYAELGKNELGRPYTDLLTTFCGHYHLRALSYILAVLTCIYIAKTDILESAGLAMVIAILGLWDQARVLVSFIFNSSVRKELAIRKWKYIFQNKGSSREQLYSELYVLADSISTKDDHFDRLCGCMAEGVFSFLMSNGSSEPNDMMGIIDISNVWEQMLDGRPNHERSMLSYNVLKYIDENLQDVEDNERRRIIVCAGYLQQQIRYYTKISSTSEDQGNNALIHILSDISQLKHKYGNNQNKIADKQANFTDCLDTLCALLIWMHFLCNNIVLGQEFQIFLSHYNQTYSESYKDVFRSFICCTFDNRACNRYFDIAWNQVGKPSPIQEEIE